MPSCFFLLFLVIKHISATASSDSGFSRHDFPPDFVFGAGSSAYQVEGAAAEDGRKPSMWDTFVHAGKAYGNGTGDIAADQYHKYKEDVKLMFEMGLDAYRFSISWSRVIPDGYGAVNPKGLNYYHNLINELVNYGIEPHVTLSHFDIPQGLQDDYKGFESPKFIEDFTAYADLCFKEYGDKEKQQGKIGITLLAFWYEPLTNSVINIAATKKAIAFLIDWLMEPIVYGRYPAIMRRNLGSSLPHFTEKESNLLKGSFDFIGLNHYAVVKVDEPTATPSVQDDNMIDTRANAVPAGRFRILERNIFRLKRPEQNSSEIGIPKMLRYIKQKYKNPTVLIHENGYATDNGDPSSPASYLDTKRIEFIRNNIQSLLESIRNGSNLKGYFVWSFLDCFESFGGYISHFGLIGVDFKDTNRKRYPRLSSYWYSSFLANNTRKIETSSAFVE
ncbi:Beta-glucosidase [Thalictrum thalictroides]|uniref:Beta-glucosidase n=1 Tax=Thalictrum thalictroides TaxID=46969 RepID=A0A7J6X1B0_THATH|nr:Beta-glucosidase [Thalictrum thalictroides]